LTEANKKLRADIEQERRIDKMRKEFINNVSHELKTPIALIQGYAEGLKLNINEDEENKNYYCDVIMDEAGKMNRLVKDLLDLSQIESGSFKLDKTSFNISSLIESVLDKYRPVLFEKGIKVELDIPEYLTVNGDAGRIEQVLVNYLINAINHVDDKKEIKIQAVILNEKVKISVCNSGENIPDESLDKIWTSFYKVDKARTRSYGGTGLGLSVVKAIQELHGNSCGMENLEDGVLFWFEVDR
ncbi:MAG: HAMP domain-containing sensor histidine kinase, partial [Syntrophaceticus schinkii]|nr:HAMP domain-containing sensor histidine kinase [Syntrophaceticus schinkii]